MRVVVVNLQLRLRSAVDSRNAGHFSPACTACGSRSRTGADVRASGVCFAGAGANLIVACMRAHANWECTNAQTPRARRIVAV